MQQIARAEDKEFLKLKISMEKVIRNMFVFTANDLGIQRFEKILGITPKAGQSLEDRRLSVAFKMINSRKISITELKEALKNCSEDIELKTRYSTDEITIIIKRKYENIQRIDEILEDNLPMNIFFSFVAKEELTKMTIREKIYYSYISYQCQLGNWRLGSVPFGKTRMEESENMDINEKFIEKITIKVKQLINKVVINNDIEIELNDISINKEGNIEISCIVEKSTIDEIRNIKLIDIEGTVIAEKHTKIAISKDIMINSIISVEGVENDY